MKKIADVEIKIDDKLYNFLKENNALDKFIANLTAYIKKKNYTLENAFDWSKTRQGSIFWNTLHTQFKIGERKKEFVTHEIKHGRKTYTFALVTKLDKFLKKHKALYAFLYNLAAHGGHSTKGVIIDNMSCGTFTWSKSKEKGDYWRSLNEKFDAL